MTLIDNDHFLLTERVWQRPSPSVNQFPKESKRQVGLEHKSFVIIRKQLWDVSSGEYLGNNLISFSCYSGERC